MHAGVFDLTSAFSMIALRAGGHDIPPDMRAAHMPGDHMIDGQVRQLPAAILACISIPTQDFLANQSNSGVGSMDHFLKANH